MLWDKDNISYLGIPLLGLIGGNQNARAYRAAYLPASNEYPVPEWENMAFLTGSNYIIPKLAFIGCQPFPILVRHDIPNHIFPNVANWDGKRLFLKLHARQAPGLAHGTALVLCKISLALSTNTLDSTSGTHHSYTQHSCSLVHKTSRLGNRHKPLRLGLRATT